MRKEEDVKEFITLQMFLPYIDEVGKASLNDLKQAFYSELQGNEIKVERVKLLNFMVQPSLASFDYRIRDILVDCSLIFFNMEFIDMLIASFFYAISIERYVNMAFIIESLTRFAASFSELL